jgi:DNA-binding NarL/FixJ family response regulator
MSIRILLADDHKIMREGLRSWLEKQPDMEVVAEAEDGPRAVQLARQLLPDVVIMDITMPGLNGIVAARQIMAQAPDVKVIALSMHSDKRFVMEMLKTGASGYLLKECAFEELARAINAVVAGHTYLSPEITGLVIDAGRYYWGETEPTALSILSRRELEVIKLIAQGKGTRQVASALRLNTKTIESHRRRIFKKLGIDNVAELTLWAIREGLVTIEP